MKKATKVPNIIFEAYQVISAASYNGFCVIMYTSANGLFSADEFNRKHKAAIAENKIIVQLVIDPVDCRKRVEFLQSEIS